MDGWELVKPRTAAEGAVWRSSGGSLFKRTGDSDVLAEARFQSMLADQGYPVPAVVETGEADGRCFFVERSVGDRSLHDRAVCDTEETGAVRQVTLDMAVEVSIRLLTAQVRTVRPRAVGEGEAWVARAGFVENVLAENPDLDTDRVHTVLNSVSERLGVVPFSHGHLDYGLPNAFADGVIDWQHHAPAPVGFDVYPMLDITAFKGGGRGYAFTGEQRSAYIAALDEASTDLLDFSLSRFLCDFLMVKCFFFLALMKPKDVTNRRKIAKWAYRRRLLMLGLESYESNCSIDTGSFPALGAFSADLPQEWT